MLYNNPSIYISAQYTSPKSPFSKSESRAGEHTQNECKYNIIGTILRFEISSEKALGKMG